MSINWKPLRQLGLGMALAAGGLSACGTPSKNDPAESVAEAPSPATLVGEDEGESGEIGHAMDTLPVEKRVAFMSGHVEAGLALFRAGAPEQAAQHLLHPVSETHAAERTGIDALGFKQDIFLGVSKALENDKPANEIAPQLAAAEANMADMQVAAGGDPNEIIAYLMDTVLEEYRIGVTDGVITDPGEYQDAFGFTVVALKIANRIEGPDTRNLIAQLETLLAMWPEGGPLADSTPTSVAEVVAQTSQVHIALQAL